MAAPTGQRFKRQRIGASDSVWTLASGDHILPWLTRKGVPIAELPPQVEVDDEAAHRAHDDAGGREWGFWRGYALVMLGVLMSRQDVPDMALLGGSP